MERPKHLDSNPHTKEHPKQTVLDLFEMNIVFKAQSKPTPDKIGCQKTIGSFLFDLSLSHWPLSYYQVSFLMIQNTIMKSDW